MNKVLTIDLNGNAFLLDEEGYVLLEDYLHNAAMACKDSVGKDEILKDLEQIIADKCTSYLNITKTVVLTDEVRQILIDTSQNDNAVLGGLIEKYEAESGQLQTSVKNVSRISVFWDDFASLISIGGVVILVLIFLALALLWRTV